MMTPHSITIEPVASRNVYGEPTAGTAVTHSAMVHTGHVKTKTREGREVVAQGVAYVDGDVAFPAQGATVTVPAEFGLASRLPILNVKRTADRTGSVANAAVYF